MRGCTRIRALELLQCPNAPAWPARPAHAVGRIGLEAELGAPDALAPGDAPVPHSLVKHLVQAVDVAIGWESRVAGLAVAAVSLNSSLAVRALAIVGFGASLDDGVACLDGVRSAAAFASRDRHCVIAVG